MAMTPQHSAIWVVDRFPQRSNEFLPVTITKTLLKTFLPVTIKTFSTASATLTPVPLAFELAWVKLQSVLNQRVTNKLHQDWEEDDVDDAKNKQTNTENDNKENMK